MRACYVLLVAAIGPVVCAAAVQTNTDTTELTGTIDSSNKRRLRAEFVPDFGEWPERLETYIEHHTRIREIMRVWCMEDKEPKEVMEERKKGTPKEIQEAAMYEKFMETKKKGDSGRKLTLIECNV